MPPHVLILLTENHPGREKERNIRLDTEVPTGREFNRNEEGKNKPCLCNVFHDRLLLIERLDVLEVRRAVVFPFPLRREVRVWGSSTPLIRPPGIQKER